MEKDSELSKNLEIVVFKVKKRTLNNLNHREKIVFMINKSNLALFNSYFNKSSPSVKNNEKTFKFITL